MGYGRLDCAVNNAAAYSGAFSLTADFTEKKSMKPWRYPEARQKAVGEF
jgi:hypothetical protein